MVQIRTSEIDIKKMLSCKTGEKVFGQTEKFAQSFSRYPDQRDATRGSFLCFSSTLLRGLKQFFKEKLGTGGYISFLGIDCAPSLDWREENLVAKVVSLKY